MPAPPRGENRRSRTAEEQPGGAADAELTFEDLDRDLRRGGMAVRVDDRYAQQRTTPGIH